MPEWVRALIKAVAPTIPRDFIGRIELNVFKGGIANVNVQQSFKEETQESRGPR